MSEKLNLHQRINEVRKKNAYIRKDKTVSGSGYKAVSHDEVTAELRNNLIEQGVLIFPSIVAGTHRVVDTGTKTKNLIPFIRLEADVAVTFVNVDLPSEREVLTLPAHAIDQGDKAPGKLISYAVKYAILKMFSIETGEDDESRHDGYVEGGLDEEVIASLKKKIDAVKTAEDGNAAWKAAKDACDAVKDESAKTMLRGYLSATMTAKGIKSGRLKRDQAGGGNGVSH